MINAPLCFLENNKSELFYNVENHKYEKLCLELMNKNESFLDKMANFLFSKDEINNSRENSEKLSN